MVQVEIFTTSNKKLAEVSVTEKTKIKDVKKEVSIACPKLIPDRQSLRTEIKGKDIKDDLSFESIGSPRKLYVKDLGPQISWTTVFLLEYAGPFFIYIIVSMRPWILYGDNAKGTTLSTTAFIALLFWSFHYLKRVLETLFIHRFSHGTMPLRNLFKNCGYYWGFCLYVAYHVNHPQFTPPSTLQQIIGLALFVVCEIGNLSIHILLRDLRPPGTTVRKIPVPNSNPLTQLFNFVSCPNYTYEFGAWFGFTLLTSCLPAGLFALAGLYQMSVWALGKHKNYKAEFQNYPKGRKAILPFIL